MRIKTTELQGAALDWAVESCEGGDVRIFGGVCPGAELYSTDWLEGGPIIERERIELRGDGDEGWIAYDNLNPTQKGATPLIAAMRCYVASKLGDEVEVPDEIL